MSIKVPVFNAPDDVKQNSQRVVDFVEQKVEPVLNALGVIEKEEHVVFSDEKKFNQILILHSRDIPNDIMKTFEGFGKCMMFDADLHVNYKLGDFPEYSYLFFDVRAPKICRFLQLCEKKDLHDKDILAYCYWFEKDCADRNDLWLEVADKILTSWPSKSYALKQEWDKVLFSPKIKYHYKITSFFKWAWKSLKA